MRCAIQSLVVVVAVTVLAGCCPKSGSGAVQQSPSMVLRDLYLPAYDYSGTAVLESLAGASAVAYEMSAHASGNR